MTPEELDTARAVFFFWSGFAGGMIVGALLALLALGAMRRWRAR